jgi:hypothetical protein
MKNSIRLSALFMLFSTGIFAAVPVKHTSPKIASIKGMVTFSTLPSRRGIEIKINENIPGKALVMIYNYENDVVWKDALGEKRGLEKGYILNQLDNGNYTIEVTLNKQMVRKTAHVYYKGDSKLVNIRS